MGQPTGDAPVPSSVAEALTHFARAITDRISEESRQQAEAMHGKVREAINLALAGVVESGPFQAYVERVAGEKAQEAVKPFLSRVQKQVEETVNKALAKDGPRTARGVPDQPGDISTVVEAEVKKCLSSEEVKILIDEKFRAISLYLKTDVVPRLIRKHLEAERT